MEREDPITSLMAEGRFEAAARVVLERYGPAVLRHIRGILRDEDLANDAFSLFAEGVWTSISHFRGESAASTWAFGVAWNAARHVRQDAWQRKRRPLELSPSARLATEIRTRSSVRQQRRETEFEELRRHLTDDERNLLLLRLENRLGWDQIAEVVSASGETVTAAALRKRFQRLTGRLRELARERGLLE